MAARPVVSRSKAGRLVPIDEHRPRRPASRQAHGTSPSAPERRLTPRRLPRGATRKGLGDVRRPSQGADDASVPMLLPRLGQTWSRRGRGVDLSTCSPPERPPRGRRRRGPSRSPRSRLPPASRRRASSRPRTGGAGSDVEPNAQPARQGHRRVGRQVDVAADVARANPLAPPSGGAGCQAAVMKRHGAREAPGGGSPSRRHHPARAARPDPAHAASLIAVSGSWSGFTGLVRRMPPVVRTGFGVGDDMFPPRRSPPDPEVLGGVRVVRRSLFGGHRGSCARFTPRAGRQRSLGAPHPRVCGVGCSCVSLSMAGFCSMGRESLGTRFVSTRHP